MSSNVDFGEEIEATTFALCDEDEIFFQEFIPKQGGNALAKVFRAGARTRRNDRGNDDG